MTAPALPVAPSGRGRLHTARVLLRLVQFEHTIFALPFAYVGAVVAAHGFPGWATLLWITVAMAGARTCAFALNRLIDREIDARNPRTAMRPSVTGEVTPPAMALLAVGSAAVLALAASQLNLLCLALAPIPVALFVVYPYCKRFTWLAHVVLGTSTAGAPVGGYLAVTGRWDLAAVLLGLVVVTWMAGFDILYALMDMEHDRAHGLRSIPQRFGIPRSLLISDGFHVLTAGMLVAAGAVASLHWPFFVFAAAAIGLLIYEHTLVSATDLTRINRAFFTINSYFAIIVLLGTIAAVAIG
jgi:4-hydroxybenzoate polyprenyltransferase